MNCAEIILQDVFDPSVMENALRGIAAYRPTTTLVTAATATSSTLIYILITISITALLFVAIWIFVDWQKKQKESYGFTAS